MKISASCHKFIDLAQPHSHWGEAYFKIRTNEYRLFNDLFGDVFERGGERFLDIGCGIGLACAVMSSFFLRSMASTLTNPAKPSKLRSLQPMQGQG